jgi:alkaline phosphatase D
VHELGDDVTTELVAVPGMTAYFLDDVVEEVYPQAAPKKQRERAQ